MSASTNDISRSISSGSERRAPTNGSLQARRNPTNRPSRPTPIQEIGEETGEAAERDIEAANDPGPGESEAVPANDVFHGAVVHLASPPPLSCRELALDCLMLLGALFPALGGFLLWCILELGALVKRVSVWLWRVMREAAAASWYGGADVAITQLRVAVVGVTIAAIGVVWIIVKDIICGC